MTYFGITTSSHNVNVRPQRTPHDLNYFLIAFIKTCVQHKTLNMPLGERCSLFRIVCDSQDLSKLGICRT